MEGLSDGRLWFVSSLIQVFGSELIGEVMEDSVLVIISAFIIINAGFFGG